MNSWLLTFLPKSRQPTLQHGAEETYKPPPLNEKLLMADGFSFYGVPWQVKHTPVDSLKHTSIRATQIELLGGRIFFKRMQSQEG